MGKVKICNSFTFAVHQKKQDMTDTRKRYDSMIPYFYSTGREDLIPEYVRKKIPASNKSKWRKMPPNRFSDGAYRHELNQLADKKELQIRLNNHRAMLYGVSRAFVALRSIFHAALKQNRNDIAQKALLVRAIRSNEQFVPVKNALRYLDIPPSTFYEWESDVKHRCDHSPLTKCVRRRPHQVTKKELRIMKRLLTSKRFEYWPIVSICYHASRQNILHFSLHQ